VIRTQEKVLAQEKQEKTLAIAEQNSTFLHSSPLIQIPVQSNLQYPKSQQIQQAPKYTKSDNFVQPSYMPNQLPSQPLPLYSQSISVSQYSQQLQPQSCSQYQQIEQNSNYPQQNFFQTNYTKFTF